MKRETGHTWSCHENDNIKCQGFIQHVKEFNRDGKFDDIDFSKGGILSFSVWEKYGLGAAHYAADMRGK